MTPPTLKPSTLKYHESFITQETLYRLGTSYVCLCSRGQWVTSRQSQRLESTQRKLGNQRKVQMDWDGKKRLVPRHSKLQYHVGLRSGRIQSVMSYRWCRFNKTMVRLLHRQLGIHREMSIHLWANWWIGHWCDIHWHTNHWLSRWIHLHPKPNHFTGKRLSQQANDQHEAQIWSTSRLIQTH